MLFTEKKQLKSDYEGSIEVICGSMFSGKTEELIRRLKRAQIAKLKVEIFKPIKDIRYHENDIVSHNQSSITSTAVENASSILLLSNQTQVVGIDEAQFLDMNIVDVCNQLANKGIRVIIAGLDMDFKGNPFGPIPHLMSIADHVLKVNAICVQCGNPAMYSYRLKNKNVNEQFLLGEKDSYEPRCRKCYYDIE